MLIQKPPLETDDLKPLHAMDDPGTMEGIPILKNGEACG